jgi:transcriptional regulator with XRE-family HTH domain
MAFLAGHIVREARLRAGMTQAQLAEKLKTTQSSVARWERASTDIGVERLQQILHACGFDLYIQLEPSDDSDRFQARSLERMSIDERLAWHNEGRSLVYRLQEAGRHATSG